MATARRPNLRIALSALVTCLYITLVMMVPCITGVNNIAY